MADCDLEDALVYPVIDRKHDIDLGDGDISHDPRVVNRQEAVVARPLFVGDLPVDAALGDLLVIGLRLGDDLVVLFRIQICDCVHIGADGPGLMKGVPPVGKCRISKQSDPDQEDQAQEQHRSMFF